MNGVQVSKRLGLALLLLQLCCANGFAAMLPQPGDRVSGRIELLGKPIPLPPGEWRVASAGFGQAMNENPGPYGAIGGVLLLRPDEERREFLLIHTNALPVQDGWGQPPECTSDEVLFRSVAEQRDRQNGCSFVAAARPGRFARSGLPALAGDPDMARQLPPWALLAGFRVSDRSDVIDMRYGVVPFGPGGAGWFVARDALDGRHRAMVARLGDWGQQARTSAMAALRDPVAQVPPMPAPRIDDTAPAAPPAQEEISTLRLALYKTATYRLPASAITMALAWALSANFYTGLEVTFWQGITHTLVYLGNDLAWEWPASVPPESFGGGRPAVPPRQAAIPPPIAIAAAGNDVPLPAGALANRLRPAAFAVDGKQVPLPEGRWTILAGDRAQDATGTILGRIEDGHLLGLAVIHTNPNRLAAIFGTSPDCSRADVAFAAIRYDTPEDGYCAYGKRVFLDQGGKADPLWTKARERLAADGVSLPRAMLMVGGRARTRENFLDARYYFAPPRTMSGAGREDSWLTLDPVAALQAWGDLAQPSIELGVRGRLPASGAELPWPWQADTVKAGLLWQAHVPLEELAAAGALDGPALGRQLAEADAAMAARERQRWSLWTRSAYKVATYKAASWVDAFMVSWIVTASPAQGAGLVVGGSVIRPMFAYANEILWAHSGVGKAPASLVPVGFPEIGRDQPPG